MSTPLTRAMTGSDAEAGASDEEFDEEFFEQPDMAGAMNSSVAIAANAIGRRRGAKRGCTFGQVMA
jgi:hypothetical protein